MKVGAFKRLQPLIFFWRVRTKKENRASSTEEKWGNKYRAQNKASSVGYNYAFVSVQCTSSQTCKCIMSSSKKGYRKREKSNSNETCTGKWYGG